MATRVELDIQDRAARVTFRGEKGIQLLSRETREELSRIVDVLHEPSDVAVVVFQAEGRTFIAGADIQELSGLTPITAHALALEVHALFTRISRLPAVTLAAIHAACAGGGCELALACDLRMAAAGARIGLPEVSLGVIPGWGGTARATRLFGGAVARRMILCGELLPAEEALRLGIVDAVAPDASFKSAVDERVQLLLSRGPQAQRQAKRFIEELEGPAIESLLEAEARAFALCYETAEPVEGMRAFFEKRPAEWPRP